MYLIKEQMYQNRLSFDLLLLISLFLIYKTSVNCQTQTCYVNYINCSNTTMFASGSTYETNLNTLFSALSSNATNNPSGYYQATAGNTSTTTVYGHYLCQGDQDTPLCLDCVITATTTDLPITCPNRINAQIWCNRCMVRYSNDSFFGKMDLPVRIQGPDPITIPGNYSTLYLEILGNLTNKVSVQAALGGPLKKFWIDVANYMNLHIIYGLGQCTPDLTPSDCNQCLSSSFHQICKNQTPGCWVLGPSCVTRYEVYSYFDLSYLPMPPPPPTPTPAIDLNPITMPSGSSGKKKVTAKVLVSIIAALLVFSVALFCICICLLKRKARKINEDTDAIRSDQDFTIESLQYDLATLHKATNNFSDENKLGEGGFGSVYKGTLPNGQLIAVKRLSSSSSQGIQEFKTEVFLVAKLQHRRLVSLLGFCYTGQEKLLVYEHVANKSLDNFLFDDENRRHLNWHRRYNIIRGIARGLLYLHHDSQIRIIHRDIKASNILLDEEMNPKISDFGTSRIFGVDQSRGNYTNRVVGTYGYMAPEYVLGGHFSIKSDTYSFGVLILEIISGTKNSPYNFEADDDLLSHAWNQWEAGTPLEFVDPAIRDSCSNNSKVMRCIHLGLLCVQESAEDRPTMANVVLTLDSYTVTLPVPQQFDFVARNKVLSTFSQEVSSSSRPLSVNEVSITEPEPRC